MKKPTPEPDPSKTALYRKRSKAKRRLTDAELKLWQRVADSVDPLPDRPAGSARAVPEPVGPVSGAGRPETGGAGKPAMRPQQAVPQPVAPAEPRHGELEHGSTAGIDKRTAQRFKKGRMAIEGRLDLHGHTQREAHVALKRFIADAYAAGKRCVLVVTGKGRRGYERDGAVGVLRQSVPRWLNEPGLRPKVLSFTHAAPPDGGEGALYVLLKRRRGEE